jgi:tetratricopeptide (TPR) repeat protein
LKGSQEISTLVILLYFQGFRKAKYDKMFKTKSYFIRVLITGFIIVSALSCKTSEQLNPDERKVTKQELAKRKENRSKSLYLDANKEKILGNYDEALKLFKQCLEINPDDAASMFELARLYLIKSNPGDALDMAEKAVDIDDNNPWYKILLAELYIDLYKYDNGIKIYSQLVKQYPDNIDYYYDWASANIYAGKMSDALKVYDLIEEKTGITDEVSIQKQKIYLQLNKVDEAAKEIEKLILHYPNDTKYIAILAELYMSNNMKEKALETYQRILEVDPDDPFVHISLADYYKKNGDKKKAFEELKIGFENPKLDIDTKVQILLSYYTVSEIYTELTEEAFILSEILVKTHPKEPKAYSIYSDFLVRDKKYEEAREALRSVIKYDSSKYIIWDQLLRMDVELDDFTSMAETSQKAMELFPEQPLPYLFSGVSNFQLQNYEKAVKSLKTGLNFVVDNNDLLENFYTYLGDAYHQTGQHKESDEAYDKALELSPDNAYVMNNFSYYLSLRGIKLDKAAEMAKKANELEPGNSSFQDTYGWIFYKMGDYENARLWVEKAIKSSKNDNPVLLEHMGDILYKLNREEEALEFWEKADKAGKGSKLLKEKIKEKKIYE